MTESMIEKCARAMTKSEAWSSFWDEDDAKKLVRAVLLALREPSEGALFAACRGRRVILSDFREAHAAMIDHILNESGKPADPI